MPSSEQSFDVVIIGAGINGAGIARDAAIRGLRVLLVDKGDISGGTSSFSTRLIHGGLRYLEHGELSLVRESLRERKVLLRIAPHLVRPIRMLVPIYKNRRRGALTIRAGMLAYDLLSFDKSLEGHQMLSRVEVLRQCSGLNAEGLLGGAFYTDAQVEFAERLVVENALSAQQHGAVIETYTRLEAIEIENGAVSGIRLSNELNGLSRNVHTRLVVNAAGPWVDQVLTKTGRESPRLIGGTKGSHIIVAPFAGSPHTAIYVEAEADGRPFFVIPWNGNYLIGTTDKRFAGDLDDVEIDESETDYLLTETNNLFPQAFLTPNSILFSYAGVRPLPFTSNASEESITRRHFLREQSNTGGLISIVGGKLTTYRQLAEETVDLLIQRLGRKDVGCRTAEEKLPGAMPVEIEFDQLEPEVRKRLIAIYGSRAVEIAHLIEADATLGQIIDSESHAVAAEVVFAFKHELAHTLTDCFLRRMMIGWDQDRSLKTVQLAAELGRQYLGWSESRAKSEVENYRRSVKRFKIPNSLINSQ